MSGSNIQTVTVQYLQYIFKTVQCNVLTMFRQQAYLVLVEQDNWYITLDMSLQGNINLAIFEHHYNFGNMKGEQKL